MEQVDKKLTFYKIGLMIVLACILVPGNYFLKENHWTGSLEIHSSFEIVSTLISLFVGIIALVRYYSKKKTSSFLLVLVFLGPLS
jgi:hypothetical protein